MQYLFRSRHYNHAKAYGLSGENGPSATIEALETFGYETAEQDPRFDIAFDWCTRFYSSERKNILYR